MSALGTGAEGVAGAEDQEDDMESSVYGGQTAGRDGRRDGRRDAVVAGRYKGGRLDGGRGR